MGGNSTKLSDTVGTPSGRPWRWEGRELEKDDRRHQIALLQPNPAEAKMGKIPVRWPVLRGGRTNTYPAKSLVIRSSHLRSIFLPNKIFHVFFVIVSRARGTWC